MEKPSDHHWDENDSTTFLDLGEIFIPERARQQALLVQLIPAQVQESFLVVELAAGEGLLAQAVLEHFPTCHYYAFDGSALMRQQMTRHLAQYRQRLTILPCELTEQEWQREVPAQVRCVLSSLSLHHISAAQRHRLFGEMATHIEPGGALLLADLIEPATAQIARVFAQQHDEIVRQQSMAIRGNLSGYEAFQQKKWNYFAYNYDNPASQAQPSPLNEQLGWLRESGFTTVDCFWLRAGFAIYGGFK